jgi:RNA polymerase sigma-70 factor (ECF subfamily)
LLRYLLAFGLPEHDGEEVIQEVFLALFEHLRGGKSRRNLRGWLFRVAHNLGLKRRMTVRQELLGDSTEQHCDPALNPEEQVASAQHQQRLRSVFKAMPEVDQRCLILRAEGLRYREIADVLNLSLGAVSLSLTRSIARLERATRRLS